MKSLALTLALGASLALGGCASHNMSGTKDKDMQNAAMAVLSPTEGNNVQGTVSFVDMGEGQLKVIADLSGLVPHSSHGIHAHEFGDCSSPDGKSAGGHYNPEHADHHLPPTQPRHAGDFGNLTADAKGNAHYEVTVRNASVNGANPVVGHAVIVHEKADTGKGDSGEAGARIACGVIEMMHDGEMHEKMEHGKMQHDKTMDHKM